MAYLASNKINVFPSTKRGNVQVSARLMSEASMVDIVNRLIDTEGFVITPGSTLNGLTTADLSPLVITNPFEFNIFGYYFKVAQVSDIITAGGSGAINIYAKITTSTIDNYTELSGQDVNSSYEGVEFIGKASGEAAPTPANTNQHILWLLTYATSGGNTGWWVPIDSRVKFVYDFAIGVDGGDLDA